MSEQLLECLFLRSQEEQQIILEQAKERVLSALPYMALGLAILQAVAWLIVFTQEIRHPPVGEFVTADGVRLHYLSQGSGRPVVFIHGNDGLLQDFKVALLPAAARYYQALAFVRPGHGYSQRESNRIVTADVQARLIHDALGKLGVVGPVIVGHSWGGAVALAYALNFPDDISGVVLLSAVAFKTPATAGSAQDIADLIPVVGDLLISSFIVAQRPWVELNVSDEFSPDCAPRDYVDTYTSLVMRPGQVKAYAQDDLTLNDTLVRMSSHYKEIACPVAIVTGGADQVVPPDLHSYPLSRAIPGSSLTIIPGAGHPIELTQVEPIMNAIQQVWQKAATQAISRR